LISIPTVVAAADFNAVVLDASVDRDEESIEVTKPEGGEGGAREMGEHWESLPHLVSEKRGQDTRRGGCGSVGEDVAMNVEGFSLHSSLVSSV
jgi:hypothetical protein